MEAEMAFLQSMQDMHEAAGIYETNGVVGADQTIPLSTEDNDQSQHVEEPSPTAHAEDPRNAFQAFSSSATSSETLIPDSTVHHPSATLAGGPVALSASNATVQAPLRPSSIEPSSRPQQSVQPRTVAGFIVDDDDDDGNSINAPELVASVGLVNAALPTGSHGLPGVSLRPVSESPDPRTSSQDVSPLNVASRSVSEGHQTDPADNSINVASVPPYSATTAVDTSTQFQRREGPAQLSDAVSARNAAAAPSAAIAKSRLPHDRVGILEDRIKDDPRGDLDAWLSLINEYRKRNKIQDARNVYERYFKVFPMAVCCLGSLSSTLLEPVY